MTINGLRVLATVEDKVDMGSADPWSPGIYDQMVAWGWLDKKGNITKSGRVVQKAAVRLAENLRDGLPISKRTEKLTDPGLIYIGSEWGTINGRNPLVIDSEGCFIFPGEPDDVMRLTAARLNPAKVAKVVHVFTEGQKHNSEILPVDWLGDLRAKQEIIRFRLKSKPDSSPFIGIQTKYYDYLTSHYPSGSWFVRMHWRSDFPMEKITVALKVNKRPHKGVVAVLAPILPTDRA